MASPIPFKYQQLIAWSLPLVGVIAAVGAVVPRWNALRNDQEELASTQQAIRTQEANLTQIRAEPAGPTVARVPATRNEPVEFLRTLNTVAASCGVRVISYTAAAAPPPPAAPAPAAPPAGGAASASAPAATPGQPALPPGTTPNVLDISAEGTYTAMALFFGRLETFPRLVSISQVTMHAAQYPTLNAQFKLTRYTGPAPDAPAMAGASPSAAASPAPSP